MPAYPTLNQMKLAAAAALLGAAGHASAQLEQLQWLEAPQDPKALAWARDQTALTNKTFSKKAVYQPVRKQLTSALQAGAPLADVILLGTRAIRLQKDATHPHGQLQVAPRLQNGAPGAWKSVLDVAALGAKEGKEYEPSIVLVCQGRKRGFLGDEVFVYDEHHFLVLSVPLPFSTETKATAEEPLLAVSIKLDPLALSELMIVIDAPERRDVAIPKGIYSTPVGKKLSNALLRLLEALANQLESKIVAPLVLREILFLVLTGEQGDALRASLRRAGDFYKIAKVLRLIHNDFAGAIDIRTLSRTSGMSVPTFHRHFKSLIQPTPIQYLKSTRLHQARLMMIRTGLTAASAALAVGYDSPSQLSREFKREFGKTPGEEANAMRTAFSWSTAMFV